MSGWQGTRARASGLVSVLVAATVLLLSAGTAWAIDEVPGSGGALQPSADVAELRSHIPDAVGASCGEAPADESRAKKGSLALILCTTSDQSTIRYELFDGLATMDTQFELTRFVMMTLGHDESARTCADGWYEGIWFLGDEGVPGRLLCQKPLYGERAAIILWSHPATRIVSFIRQTDGNAEAAWNLWIAAGPS
jgi:hypothetical protein